MFEGQPKGLYALALANTGERFGYYTMLAVFALFLRANFGLEPGVAGGIYSTFLMLVYFLPLFGGMLADRFGFGRMVTGGIFIMFFGYLLLSVPLGGAWVGMVAMMAALLLISFGTGLFKGNLQVIVGNLYDDPRYADKRDAGFSIFYMAINIGALFAPTAAVAMRDWAMNSLGYDGNAAYHFSFAVACLSLIASIAIYYAFRSTFTHALGDKKGGAAAQAEEHPLTAAETRQRIIALCLVFAVVLFFWMAFHQNGLTLTYFADEYGMKSVDGATWMPFDVVNLVAVVFLVYALFSVFQSATVRGRSIAGAVAVVAVGVLYWKYTLTTGSFDIQAPLYQQFNPFYVVALTPVSMAIFGSLARKGKEPTAPRKIAYGMLVAAVAYAFMMFACLGYLTPDAQAAAAAADKSIASPNILITTYLILTFGELLLSPMGISFVSKVAPPQYKGMMMGGWFVATAVGNLLVSVGGFLWGGLSLEIVWGVFACLCLLSAVFMFSIMKKLEQVC